MLAFAMWSSCRLTDLLVRDRRSNAILIVNKYQRLYRTFRIICVSCRGCQIRGHLHRGWCRRVLPHALCTDREADQAVPDMLAVSCLPQQHLQSPRLSTPRLQSCWALSGAMKAKASLWTSWRSSMTLSPAPRYIPQTIAYTDGPAACSGFCSGQRHGSFSKLAG